MSLFGKIVEGLLDKMVTQKMSDEYEKSVIIPCLEKFKLPSTSRYYQAYYVGLLHGREAQKSGRGATVEAIVERVVKRKKEQEKAVADKAVEGMNV